MMGEAPVTIRHRSPPFGIRPEQGEKIAVKPVP